MCAEPFTGTSTRDFTDDIKDAVKAAVPQAVFPSDAGFTFKVVTVDDGNKSTFVAFPGDDDSESAPKPPADAKRWMQSCSGTHRYQAAALAESLKATMADSINATHVQADALTLVDADTGKRLPTLVAWIW